MSIQAETAAPNRYVVGMDLGTTNCAVAYVDTHDTPWRVRDFFVPQLVAPAEIESRETLGIYPEAIRRVVEVGLALSRQAPLESGRAVFTDGRQAEVFRVPPLAGSWKTAVVAFVVLELLALYMARDNLTLNIIMFLFPLEALKDWQMEAMP